VTRPEILGAHAVTTLAGTEAVKHSAQRCACSGD